MAIPLTPPLAQAKRGRVASVNGTRLPNLMRRILFPCRRKPFPLARSSLNSFSMVVMSGAEERQKWAAMSI